MIDIRMGWPAKKVCAKAGDPAALADESPVFNIFKLAKVA